MNGIQVLAIAAVVIALVGAYVYSQQIALDRARIANSPGNLIGAGIGGVVSGVIGLATASAR